MYMAVQICSQTLPSFATSLFSITQQCITHSPDIEQALLLTGHRSKPNIKIVQMPMLTLTISFQSAKRAEHGYHTRRQIYI
jgi:hypothetical protein